MDVAIVTGSAGLVGSAAVEVFTEAGFHVVGIDNDQRSRFFGEAASTSWRRRELEAVIPSYRHEDVDIRDEAALQRIFGTYSSDIMCVIHAAGQPSHDWAAQAPRTDFDINARASVALLEATRARCPEASFVFMSTNKVYGDRPNDLPFVESATRWELESSHPYFENGIDESMPVDRCTHSLFGASKLAADLMVQEYGRYFGLKTACFRAGCVTGPAHAGTQQHGFLSFLVKCAIERKEYAVLGYKGKQVRDNIHARDLAAMFLEFVRRPHGGEVYNVGGGRKIHCSLLEAVAAVERISGEKMRTRYIDEARLGDHQWYVSDTCKFQDHYPDWRLRYDLNGILVELVEARRTRPGR